MILFTNTSAQAGYDTRSIFKRSLTGWRNQSILLFTHSWRENNWIHTFPKGISAMWNAVSLVQDLNACRRVHFLRRKPLHHGHLLCIWWWGFGECGVPLDCYCSQIHSDPEWLYLIYGSNRTVQSFTKDYYHYLFEAM